jgi:hypothetical protein
VLCIGGDRCDGGLGFGQGRKGLCVLEATLGNDDTITTTTTTLIVIIKQGRQNGNGDGANETTTTKKDNVVIIVFIIGHGCRSDRWCGIAGNVLSS